MRQRLYQLTVVVVAVGLFTGMSIAPVAASDGIGDDSPIDIDTDDGIGLEVGGDDGIGVGVDDDGLNATVGGSDGVTADASADDGAEVGVGGDDGVTVDADAEDGAEVGVGDGVGAGVDADDGVSVDVGDEGVEAGPDGIEIGDEELGDGEFGEGDLEDIALDVDNLSDGESGLDEFDEFDNEFDPTDVDFDTNELPEEAQLLTQLLEAYPEINETGPEDFPIGDEDAEVNVCEPLALESDDLPADSLPGINDLPDELVPPGVPTDILTNRAVLGLLLGLVPEPCEVVHPNDPQIDPTDLPDEPRGQFDIQRFGEFEFNGSQGGVVLFDYDGTLNDSEHGPGISGYNGLLITEEFGDIDNELMINDGRNDYGIDQRTRYNEDGSESEVVLILLGQQAGAGGECDAADEDMIGDLLSALNPEEIDGNSLGPCEFSLIGLPNLVTLEDGVGIVTGALEDPELPGGDDDLPLDELLAL